MKNKNLVIAELLKASCVGLYNIYLMLIDQSTSTI